MIFRPGPKEAQTLPLSTKATAFSFSLRGFGLGFSLGTEAGHMGGDGDISACRQVVSSRP